MKELPGFPQRNLPRIAIEAERTPASIPPETVQIRGKGWSVSLPVALAIGIAAGIAGKLWPSQTDTRTEAIQLAQQRDALAQEQFREDLRKEIAALRQDIAAVNTRVSVLEATRSALPRVP